MNLKLFTNRIWLLITIFILSSFPLSAEEIIKDFKEESVQILNEELRRLQETDFFNSDGTNIELKDAKPIDMQSQKIISLTDPTAAQDAATKNYVDGKTSCVIGFAASGGVGIATGTTKYASFFGGAFGSTNWNSTEANRQHILPYAGTAKNLYIRTTGAQPSAGNLVFTVRKGGAATALTITVAADEAAGTKTDLTNEVSFVAGDLICLQGVNNDGVDTSALINQWSLEYVK